MHESPHAKKAERVVLVPILLDPLPSFSKITISKDDFLTHKNQVLFEQLKDMYVNNLLLDIITIRNYLKDNKKLDVIGDGDYLLELQAAIIIPNHV